MGWETFLTKDSAFSPRTCDWYTVSPLVYATFRLETCDDLCYATIQDTALNELVRLSKGNETFTIKAPGRYKICVKGVNTRGRIMVSVNAASAAGPDCCNDLQMKIEELEQKIDALPGTDTKTVIKAGTNVTVNEEVVNDTHTYTVNATASAPVSTVEVEAGRGIDVQKAEVAGKTTFTVASTEPTVEVKGGKGIQVDKETLADTINYKVSIPDGTFVDTDTKTVVKAGANVTVSEDVVGDTHTFTVSSTAAGTGTNVQVSQGDNITVEKATLPGGTVDYKVSATVPDVSEFTTKTYVDDQNAQTLQSAKDFATDAADAALNEAKAYADTKATETLSAANKHSDEHDATTLAAANAHADTKADAAETTTALAGKADRAATLSEIARIDAAIEALKKTKGVCVRGPLPHEFNGDFLVNQGPTDYTAEGGTGFVGGYTGIDGVWAEKNGTAKITVRKNARPQTYVQSGDEGSPNSLYCINADFTSPENGNAGSNAALKFFVPDVFAYCVPIDVSNSPKKFQKIRVALCIHPVSGLLGCKKIKVGLSVHVGNTPIADANQPEPVVLTLNTSLADYPDGGWFIAEFDPSKAFANLPMPSVSDDMLKSFGYLKVTLTLSEAAGELAWQNGTFMLLRYRVLREGEEPCSDRQAYQDALYDCQRYFQVINTQISGRRLGEEQPIASDINGKNFVGRDDSLIRQMAKVPKVTVDQSQAEFDGCTFEKVEVTDHNYTVLVDVGTGGGLHGYSAKNLKLTFDARPDLK